MTDFPSVFCVGSIGMIRFSFRSRNDLALFCWEKRRIPDFELPVGCPFRPEVIMRIFCAQPSSEDPRGVRRTIVPKVLDFLRENFRIRVLSSRPPHYPHPPYAIVHVSSGIHTFTARVISPHLTSSNSRTHKGYGQMEDER